jgi:hypothetical protein
MLYGGLRESNEREINLLDTSPTAFKVFVKNSQYSYIFNRNSNVKI